MKHIKTTLLSAAAMVLMTLTANAHPDKHHDKTVEKEVTILKLKTDAQINGGLSLEDLERLEAEGLDLENLDVDVSRLDDGSTKIIVRNRDETRVSPRDKNKSRHSDTHSGKDVKIIMKHAEAGEVKFPHSIDLDVGVEVFIGKDGGVTMMKNGKVMSQNQMRDHDLSIEKSVTNNNGKKKIRVVIEMETED